MTGSWRSRIHGLRVGGARGRDARPRDVRRIAEAVAWKWSGESGVASGTWAAVVAAIGAFLIYNFLFTEPLYTFMIADPGVLLSVVLLLFVGIVVGQLAAMQRSRAELALAREREARAVFSVSRVLAIRESTEKALGQTEILRVEAGMQRGRVRSSHRGASPLT
jgi:hypothetical protein